MCRMPLDHAAASISLTSIKLKQHRVSLSWLSPFSAGHRALASEIILGIEVGGWKSGRFAGQRIDVQPVAGVAGKIVKIDIAAPVEHRVARAQAAAKLLLGLLDHVHGID